MVKKLRRKFIGIAMLAVVCTLGILITTINVMSYRSVEQTADRRLSSIAEYGGSLDALRGERGQTPPPGGTKDPSEGKALDSLFNGSAIGGEFAFDARYFTVTMDADGQVTDTDLTNIAVIEETEAQELAQKLYASGRMQGFDGNYRYLRVDKADAMGNGSAMYIFLDASRELASFENFRNASILISLAGVLILFGLVTVISGYVVRPMAESYEKQKRFITEASHEIKTPIAIIQANTEVIEIENGENDWTRGIRKQTGRLTELTDNLVTLSRMEEDHPLVLAQEVDLSGLVHEIADTYEAPAVAGNKSLSVSIADGIRLTGDEKMLDKMVSMLMDNAIKYSAEGSDITLKLAKAGRKRRITVSNSVENIRPGDHKELFDRFYRTDSSHNSRNGGSGIGLAMVHSIAQAHGGSATAYAPDDHTIEFIVEL